MSTNSPKKPARLRVGDTVAVVSPSSGSAHQFPYVLELGLRNIERIFGCMIREFPTTRMSDEKLFLNPKLRADDINRAFADPEIKAIIATIGGDDSVRILPFLNLEAIARNPKILMGYSDTTTLTTVLNQSGLVTFNGPSVMAGFAQARHLPAEFEAHVHSLLAEPSESYEYRPYTKWSNRYQDWGSSGYDGETAGLLANDEGWQWLQGSGAVEGRLYGGCIEVLEFMKGTEFWPGLDFWNDKILFLETSEDKPTVSQVKYMVRNYGSMGVLDRIRALLFGRARSYSSEEKSELYETLSRVASVEFARSDLPIVANLDFGHTDPQFVMPLGARAKVDCEMRSIRLSEPAVE